MNKNECEHFWIAGGTFSDWVCENCGKRCDIDDL